MSCSFFYVLLLLSRDNSLIILYLSSTHDISILFYSSATLISDSLNILLHNSTKYVHSISGINAKSLIVAIFPIFLVWHVFLKFVIALLISKLKGLSSIYVFTMTPNILICPQKVLCTSPIVYCLLLHPY
jgi:hypothetical protein